MILLSLNIRGVGGHLKDASFRRLISRISPDIIFLQETMVDSKKARHFLNQFLPNWHYLHSVNSLGTSRGLAVAWNPDHFDFLPYLCCGGILLTGTVTTKKRLNLINIYGPCSDRQHFWEKLEIQGASRST
jgi:exonuclease III